jgi:hypothetical protein
MRWLATAWLMLLATSVLAAELRSYNGSSDFTDTNETISIVDPNTEGISICGRFLQDANSANRVDVFGPTGGFIGLQANYYFTVYNRKASFALTNVANAPIWDSTNAVITEAVWHTMCACHQLGDDSVFKMYVDGSDTAGSWSVSGDITPINSGDNYIGAAEIFGSMDRFFNGDIAEVALWDIKLTNAECQSITIGAPMWQINRSRLRGYWLLLGGTEENHVTATTVSHTGTTEANGGTITWWPIGGQ